MKQKLYCVRFYGLNKQGETMFDKGGYYIDSDRARKAMDMYTNDFNRTLNSYLYPEGVSLYVHLIVRELEDGEYKYKKSGIWSCCEDCELTIYKDINPMFKEL